MAINLLKEGEQMNIAATIKDWKIVAIPPCAKSPMQNHKGGEIAVDDENKTFYAWEIFIVTYGLDSIIKSCTKYLNR
jgi:hypothetical protein